MKDMFIGLMSDEVFWFVWFSVFFMFMIIETIKGLLTKIVSKIPPF